MKSLTIQTEVTKADLNNAMLNYEQRLMQNTQILEMQRRIKSSQSIGHWLEWLVKIIISGLMLLQIIVCVVGIIYQPLSVVFFLCVLLFTTLLVGMFFWAERKWGKKVNGKLLLDLIFLVDLVFSPKKMPVFFAKVPLKTLTISRYHLPQFMNLSVINSPIIEHLKIKKSSFLTKRLKQKNMMCSMG